MYWMWAEGKGTAKGESSVFNLSIERMKLHSLRLGRKWEEQVWVYQEHSDNYTGLQMSIRHPYGTVYQAVLYMS